METKTTNKAVLEVLKWQRNMRTWSTHQKEFADLVKKCEEQRKEETSLWNIL